jgi:acyl dehydratase
MPRAAFSAERGKRKMTDSESFRVGVDNRYFEDYIPGSVHEFGPITVEEEEIIAFAKRYDPQVFHTEPEAAAKSIYGGLIASGWLTGSLTMRLFADHYLSHVASLGSPGVREMRWVAPVRPGDELRIRVTVLEARRSNSKPDRGIVRSYIETLNQKDEIVLTMEPINFMLCRPL